MKTKKKKVVEFKAEPVIVGGWERYKEVIIVLVILGIILAVVFYSK
jgi:hypothetical protein